MNSDLQSTYLGTCRKIIADIYFKQCFWNTSKYNDLCFLRLLFNYSVIIKLYLFPTCVWTAK